MALEEIVISRHIDPDFGVLELIETPTEAAVNGAPSKPLIFRQWTGKLADVDATLGLSNAEDPPVVTEEVRAAFRSVLSNVDDFKRRIARSKLELARNWVAAAKMNLPLDESALTNLLKIDGFTIGSGRLTVWLQPPITKTSRLNSLPQLPLTNPRPSRSTPQHYSGSGSIACPTTRPTRIPRHSPESPAPSPFLSGRIAKFRASKSPLAARNFLKAQPLRKRISAHTRTRGCVQTPLRFSKKH
jgi:hypothetical protein